MKSEKREALVTTLDQVLANARAHAVRACANASDRDRHHAIAIAIDHDLACKLALAIDIARATDLSIADYLARAHARAIGLDSTAKTYLRDVEKIINIIVTARNTFDAVGKAAEGKKRNAVAESSPRPIRALNLLAWFSEWCSKPNRETVELATRDLKKDAAKLRRKNRSKTHIERVMLWHVVTGTMLPIAWNACLRFLAAILPIAKIIIRIKGMLSP